MDALARPKDDLFDNSTMTVGEHLEELRGALVKAIMWLAIGLAFGLLVANRVVRYVQEPLKEAIIQYNADRDLALLGISNTDDPATKRFHRFLTQNALVAELVYALPTPLSPSAAATLAAADAGQVGDAEAEAPDGDVAAGKSKEDAATVAVEEAEKLDGTRRIDTADLISAIGAVPDPDAMVPTIQFRRSERGVSSLKVEETFMIWVKAGLIVGAVLASPMIFYHLWSFVAAGLHSHERRYVYIYLPFSVVLFVSGVALAFFLVLQYVLSFLLAFNSSMDVAVEPRLSYYVNFVLMLPLGFGVAFQLPLVMLFLQRIDLIQTKDYISSWRIATLVIFIISMVVTPADVTSMVALAIPLMLLYFLGIGLCLYMPRGRGLGSGAYDPA
ncbi:twin-arginine translocase subunit TatC [Aporhodopirellula aestuarii]|uniref:Sec-independent protein translocase protein TatC n=1 Tax=Aporhodopirellula aestuarii TaxID=2950107 RepID=A0ABT0UAE9_9BACT|nr:twin-arginine translocase subunit TatC [Aporhodopirellula aestuarii]MCM2373878.1 twin-arginine translocase subunit TatC [Aporhodopirellula aestuarii]